MPRACPVEYYARRYTADLKQPPGCHGLVPWSITLVAIPPISNNRLDATGLSRGVLRSSLYRRSQTTPGCHGLVPWSITLVATPPISNNRLDATGLSRGVLPPSLPRRSQTTAWMPRACPVEYYARRYTADLKQPPGCHGLVPWSITLVATPPISNNRLDATGLSRGASR